MTLPVCTALAGVMLAGCGGDSTGASAEKAAVVMGTTDRIAYTDPAAGYDPGSWVLFNNVYQTLLAFPRGGVEPVPEAAEECRFDQGGNKVYTCTLKSGLTFSNGDPLTAKDVKFSFDRMMRINHDNGPAVLFTSLDEVLAPSDKRVVFRLKHADASFPQKLASGAGAIVNRSVYPADKLLANGKVVGSGVYRLDSYKEDKEAVLTPNPSYKGTAETQNSGMTMRIYPGDQTSLRKAVDAGDVDFAYRGLSAKDIADLQTTEGKKEGIKVVQGNGAELQHLVFNMKDPVVGKKGVREAIAHLIDRKAFIRDVYRRTVDPLYSIVPAGITGHNTAFYDRYGAQPSKAQAAKALSDAGISTPVRLTLHTTPVRYDPNTDEQVEAIAQQLEASGLFEVTVKSVEWPQYREEFHDGRYSAYIVGWVPDYPDPENFTAPFFGEGNVLANSYTNERITGQLIPRTYAETDRSAAVHDYQELQNQVAEDVPMIPLWQSNLYAVAKQEVSGLEWTLDPSTVFRFWEISKND
ncbi:ABC transporter substrate-binding protein [Streptomyces thermolineatus]|uniref:ABC transporter substrate-binding protein n=2 Tax=Streptomyces TaxID=1883 RepID=A0ABP5YIQ8_9ACTN